MQDTIIKNNANIYICERKIDISNIAHFIFNLKVDLNFQ